MYFKCASLLIAFLTIVWLLRRLEKSREPSIPHPLWQVGQRRFGGLPFWCGDQEVWPPTEGGPVLLVGDCDWTFPDEYPEESVKRAFARFSRIYAQNLNPETLNEEQSRIVRPFPIGLDLHTRPQSWKAQYDDFTTRARRACRFEERDSRVLVTWAGDTPYPDKKGYKGRDVVRANCLSCPLFVDGASPHREATWDAMSRHKFVYVPAGNGLDTHRLWEAVGMGCVALGQDTPFHRGMQRWLPLHIVDEEEVDEDCLSFCESLALGTEAAISMLRSRRWIPESAF